MRKLIFLLFALNISVIVHAQQKKVASPTLTITSQVNKTIKVSQMKPVTPKEWQQMVDDRKNKSTEHRVKHSNVHPKTNDPVLQDFMPIGRGANAPLLTFEGAQSAGFPSDATGSVDSNYYVQAVNATFSVYDKTGTLKAGPIALNTLFTGLPGATYNDGDPIVMYDANANRWLITEMSKSGDNDYLMMAVSQTSSPLGAWYSYSFDVDDWPDYPKYGIWRDGYYIGIDKLGNNTQDQEDVFAVERDKMLLGQAAKMVGFINPNRPNVTYSIAAPIDNEGAFAAANTPALFVAISDDQWNLVKDQLWIYEMDVDWNNTLNSTFSMVQALDVASFTPGPDPTQPGGYGLDGLASYIMNKPVYRNFGNHQELVCCHAVEGSSGLNAGMRWYELRKTEGDWEIRQQGTYSPDNDSRWVGSITMNSNHTIAMGYSVTGSSTYPGIRYAAQSPTAYAAGNGVFDVAEETIYSGNVIQSNSSRWGDYSNISIDPSNDSIFWYTNQYVGVLPKTKVSKFKFGPFSLSADFFANNTNVEVGEIVKFYDISYGSPTTWNWSFSPNTLTYAGSTNSSSQNPWVQFTNAGTYSVTLTVNDGSTNNSITKTSYITVLPYCTVSTFPWSEGFENAGNIPTCWSQDYVNNYNEDWQFVTGDNGATGFHNSAHTGTYNTFFQKDGALTRLVLPKMDLSSLTTPQIDFWYIQDGNSTGYDEFSVMYKHSLNSDWVTLKTFKVKKSSWTHDTIVLPNNTSESYIAFQNGISNGGYGVLIDDIKIEESGVACAPPLGPVSNPSGTSAVISWIDQLYSPTWEIEYGPNGFVQGTGTSVTGLSDSTYTISGLSTSTTYNWYVRKNCGGTPAVYSLWTGPNSFTTTTVPFTLPVSEDFESGLVKFINPSGNDINFASNSSLHHGGSKSVRNNYSNYNSNYLEMASYVDLSATSYPTLSFWHIGKITNDGDYCKVQISTDNGSSWVTLPTKYYEGSANNYSSYQRFNESSYSIWGGSPANNTWWKKETYSLEAYKSDKVRVRFWLFANSSGTDEGWYIDDILIEDLACPGIYADSLWTQNITATTAELKWKERGSATAWDIEYGNAGFTQGSGVTVSGTTTNPYSLSPLTASTDYDWYVRSSCGGGNYSDWSGPISFSTPCNPTNLPYFEDFENVTTPYLPTCMTNDDANNDGVKWQIQSSSGNSGTGSLFIGTPTNKSSDDWFFTQGFSLQAGVSYEIAFVYSSAGGHESLELKYGNYPESSSMGSTALWTDTDITVWSFTLGRADIIPSTTGVYYFGFHAGSPIGSGGIYLDDIYVNFNSSAASWTGASSNDWYTPGNWNNDTLPTSLTNVSILPNASNFPTLNSLSLAKNFTLESNATGSASLMGEGYLKVSGQINVKQFVSSGKWHHLSASISSATTSDLYFNHNPDVWLMEYGESSNTWSYISSLSRALNPGEGFLVWIEANNDTTFTFTGTLNSSDIYLDGSAWSVPQLFYSGANFGFNMVGNPFPSALDWDLNGWDTTGIDGSIWVWNSTSGNYSYRNSQGQGSLTNGIIPRTQGFFIRANDANMYFTIPTAARVHSNQAYYKSTSGKGDVPYVVIEAEKDGQADEAWVSFMEQATNNYDNGMDVEKMFSSKTAPEIYFNNSMDDLSIIALPPLEEEAKVIDLAYVVGESGHQSLFLKDANMMDAMEVLLEDTKLNIIQDLKKNPQYTFAAETGDDPNRLRLHFTNLAYDIAENRMDNKYNVYSNNSIIYITRKGETSKGEYSVSVTDLQGRKLVSTSSLDKVLQINTVASSNFYIVKIFDAHGTEIHKVFNR